MASLLEQFKSIAVTGSTMLTVANIFLIPSVYTLPNLYTRALVLSVVTGFSYLNLRMLFHAQRINPIVSLISEWTDSETLMALAQKANVNLNNIKQPVINIQDLVLDHYLFLGLNGLDHAKKMINYFASVIPGTKLLDLSNDIHKMQLPGIISERQAPNSDRTPRIILTDSFNSVEAQDMAKIGVYYFVISQNDQPVRKKILDHEYAKQFEPGTKVTLGFWDSIKLYQLTLV